MSNPTLLKIGERPKTLNATNGNTFFVGLPRRNNVQQRRQGLLLGLSKLSSVPDGAIGVAVIDGEGHVLEQRSFPRDDMWTSVLGRHGASELFIRYPALSLRHLFLFHRAGSDTVSVFDLRSGSGTQLFTGQQVQRMQLQAPFALACGDLWLVVGSHFDPHSLPCIVSPDAIPSPWLVQLERYALQPDAALQPPVKQQMVVAHDVIFGRSERCDLPSNWDSHPTDLSRVHALFFSDGDRSYIADTASSGGVRHVHDGPVRLRRVEPGDAFWLGKELRVSFERMTR